MNYSIDKIAEIVEGHILNRGTCNSVLRVLLDTRKISQPDSAVFVAIRGERYDGHRFVFEAYKAGVRTFLVDRDVEIKNLSEATVIRVKDSVGALQKLAAYHRLQFDIPIVGVTGSNGKTIVKEWLNTLLADDFIIVRNPRSYNSQVGVPLSVLNIEPHHTLGIFEAGISQPGEMQRLEEVILPLIGIFTNVGTAHRENYSSQQEIADEKIKLFAHTNKIIYCSDYQEIEKALSNAHMDKGVGISWSLNNNTATLHVETRHTALQYTELKITGKKKNYRFLVHFSDDASIENCIHCIVSMLELGYSEETIQSRLERLVPLAMRLELLQGVNECLLINDVYSSDLYSLEIALDFMNVNSRHKKKVVILSDMAQTGLVPEELYTKVDELLKAKSVEHIIGIGADISSVKKVFSMHGEFYATSAVFLRELNIQSVQNSIILIKGARNFHFEEITERLQARSHETVLEINLNALSHNFNYFKSKVRQDTKMMVMVKASGYGSGSHEIASLLEFNKVDYLAVAYTDEGIALRNVGISTPIMVMNPEQNSLAALVRNKLEPEIYSFHKLNDFLSALPETHTTPYPIHIKVDTGMHRLGFMPNEVEELQAILKNNHRIRIASVFTHLAAADDEEHDAFTLQQLSSFKLFCERLKAEVKDKFLMHALNTAGILRFPEAQFDMVRLGIGIYGVSPRTEEQEHLKVVGTLKTVVSQIKNIKVGESIGYSRKFVAKNNMKSATIPLGYADGLRRALGNGNGYVLINGEKAFIVGNVCMDMLMVDVTNITCEEGDSVEVFGENLSLQTIAERCNTIPYEILTSISQRVKRIYMQE